MFKAETLKQKNVYKCGSFEISKQLIWTLLLLPCWHYTTPCSEFLYSYIFWPLSTEKMYCCET